MERIGRVIQRAQAGFERTRVPEAVQCDGGSGEDIPVGTVDVDKKAGGVIHSFHTHGPVGGFL